MSKVGNKTEFEVVFNKIRNKKMIKDLEVDKKIKIRKNLTPKKTPIKINKNKCRLNSIDKILKPSHKDNSDKKKDIKKVHMIVKSLESTSSKMMSPQGKRLEFGETTKMKRNTKKKDLVLQNQNPITAFFKNKSSNQLQTDRENDILD